MWSGSLIYFLKRLGYLKFGFWMKLKIVEGQVFVNPHVAIDTLKLQLFMTKSAAITKSFSVCFPRKCYGTCLMMQYKPGKSKL